MKFWFFLVGAAVWFLGCLLLLYDWEIWSREFHWAIMVAMVLAALNTIRWAIETLGPKS